MKTFVEFGARGQRRAESLPVLLNKKIKAHDEGNGDDRTCDVA